MHCMISSILTDHLLKAFTLWGTRVIQALWAHSAMKGVYVHAAAHTISCSISDWCPSCACDDHWFDWSSPYPRSTPWPMAWVLYNIALAMRHNYPTNIVSELRTILDVLLPRPSTRWLYATTLFSRAHRGLMLLSMWRLADEGPIGAKARPNGAIQD